VGDNFMASRDPSEQTFQVSLIVKHEKFIPLSSPGGDGRNDIALLYIRTRAGRGISFDKYVSPACLPSPDTKLKRWSGEHCEISGWGMQEYNNTNSYPDSVRAAKIAVNTISTFYHLRQHQIVVRYSPLQRLMILRLRNSTQP